MAFVKVKNDLIINTDKIITIEKLKDEIYLLYYVEEATDKITEDEFKILEKYIEVFE